MLKYWFDHVHLNSSDPLATAEYYEKIFGATRVSTQNIAGGRILVALDLNGTRFVVTTTASYQITTSEGKAISVLEQYGIRTNDIEGAVAEMKAAGVKFVREITRAASGIKYAHFITNDNVIVELLERSE